MPWNSDHGDRRDTGALGADGLGDGLGDLEGEARAVLDAAAPLVGTLVGGVLVELIDQVTVGCVDLHSVETSLLDSVGGSLCVVLDVLLDLLLGQGAWCRGTLAGGDVRGRDKVAVAGGLHELLAGDAAEGPELEPEEAALGVDGIGDFFPGGNLLVGEDTRDVGVSASRRGNDGGFGDQQGAGNTSTLGVVLLDHGHGDVVVLGAEASKRGHDQAVGECVGSDLEGLKELVLRNAAHVCGVCGCM
jgi:hypothetical protein